MDEGTKKELCLAGRIWAFSVSSSNIATVIKYIDNQEAHHRKISFEDEFIALLKKHKIPFDPKYVFN
jgi:putative transposase